ncbi:MAG TPA: helix-hairpin-helix domain-containing protein [Candidatus Baltobacteraceae bacterium]|jgi:competence protein ComEA
MTRILLIGAGIVFAAIAIWHRPPHGGALALAQSTSPRAPAAAMRRHGAATRGGPLVVYVVGAVAHPGLYALADGARAAEAVRRAGGLLPAADPMAINLAERLSDGEELAVVRLGEIVPARARAPSRTRQRRSRSVTHTAPAAPIELNAADAASLERLPGIGPTLAARIVAYRELNGPFGSLDELADVAGMTDRRIEQVSPFLLVH